MLWNVFLLPQAGKSLKIHPIHPRAANGYSSCRLLRPTPSNSVRPRPLHLWHLALRRSKPSGFKIALTNTSHNSRVQLKNQERSRKIKKIDKVSLQYIAIKKPRTTCNSSVIEDPCLAICFGFDKDLVLLVQGPPDLRQLHLCLVVSKPGAARQLELSLHSRYTLEICSKS